MPDIDRRTVGPSDRPAGPLVSTAWLAARLEAPDFRVLDASWYLPGSGREAAREYLEAHVPGAVFFDLDEASDHRTTLPHMLPALEDFAALAGRLGIRNDSTLIVYDGSGANFSAARVWWMFRVFGHRQVAVLDGGFGKWTAEGRPVEKGAPEVVPVRFEARLDASLIRTRRQVEAHLRAAGAQVVDLRSKGRFTGQEPEPRPVPSGHIPGSLNLPYGELVRPDGTLLPPEALRARLREAGVDPGRPVIATCGSGTSACALLLALESLGPSAGKHALYDGAWTEWAGSGMPIERG
jgi:thiosulfate/3-mercaptopyruvate sulfurtransferase